MIGWFTVLALAEDAMKAAGEYYNIRVPITGEFLIGNNWAEVH